MSSLSTVSNFANWYVSTREARATPANKIQNEASLRSWILGDALGGRSTRKIIRGGKWIEDRVRLTRQSNFGKFKPGATMTTSRVRTTYELKVPWAHYRNHYPLTEWETQFNEGDLYAQFKAFRPTVDDELAEDHWTGIELALWKIPDSSTMEGLTIEMPDALSIPAIITENTTSTYAYRSPNWGNNPIAGISPTTWTNWRNVVSRYTPGALDDPNTGLFAAMAYAYTTMQVQAPPQLKGIVDEDMLDRVGIYTNDDGKIKWENMLRASNSITRNGANDPSYQAEYMGNKIKNVDALNTIALDEDPTTGVYNSQAYPAGKPRYFCLNWKYLYPVFHGQHFARVTRESGGASQPGTEVLIQDTTGQLLPLSRRRHAIVCPST